MKTIAKRMPFFAKEESITLDFLKKFLAKADDDIKLYKEVYNASNGLEIFLSYECKPKNLLIGFTRIRLPSKKIKSSKM